MASAHGTSSTFFDSWLDDATFFPVNDENIADGMPAPLSISSRCEPSLEYIQLQGPVARSLHSRIGSLDHLLAQGDALIQETAEELKQAYGCQEGQSLFDNLERLLFEGVAPTSVDSIHRALEPTPIAAEPAPPVPPPPLPLPNLCASASVVSLERMPARTVSDASSYQDDSVILRRLGTELWSKADQYVDAVLLCDPGIPSPNRGGFSMLFPEKLHAMLCDAKHNGKEDVISFCPHGRAFVVRDVERFESEILPVYFKGQRKWGSFYRQLHLYGFLRVSSGPDAGAYYHPLFLRDRVGLSRYMCRVRKAQSADRRRSAEKSASDPDFYAFSSL